LKSAKSKSVARPATAMPVFIIDRAISQFDSGSK
jgi:hypothetical protein